MHWNGYAGWVMGVGGAIGCDGAVRLHGAHRSLILCMAGVIPGQKIEHYGFRTATNIGFTGLQGCYSHHPLIWLQNSNQYKV